MSDIKPLFKPTPCLDMLHLNNWRDKLINNAQKLGILMGPRECIDFAELFEQIKEVYKLNSILENTYESN